MIKTCKHCGVEIDWEGHDDHKGIIWSCEKCGECFCSKCAEDNDNAINEDTEDILCNDCK